MGTNSSAALRRHSVVSEFSAAVQKTLLILRVCGTGMLPVYRRRRESGKQVDIESSDDGLWLEFNGLTTTTDCRSVQERGSQIRRPRLAIYVHNSDTSTGNTPAFTGTVYAVI